VVASLVVQHPETSRWGPGSGSRLVRMTTYTSPGEVRVDAGHNLTTSLWTDRRVAPDRPALAAPEGEGFRTWTMVAFVDEVEALARGLIALGVGPGDRVALFSATRIEFTLLDYAVWAAGAVTVPLYETSSAEQVAWIVEDSGSRLLLCETAELAGLHAEVAERTPGCERVLVIEDGALELLRSAGKELGSDQVAARVAATTTSAIATIVYTSGTTGRPKGCVLTHGNLLWDAAQVEEAGREFFFAGRRTLLFLPLAHIFARIIQVSAVRSGVLLGFSRGISSLSQELVSFSPDFILAVPRVFEKVYNGARQRAEADGKARVFDLAAATAVRYSRERQAGRVAPQTRLARAAFDRLVYAKLRAALGGRARYAISGGAALGERLGHFFNGIGVTVLEGYGLTETSAGATINRPRAQRIGSVGKPVPGASVRIAEDGEIELFGQHIFQGYHRDPAATAEVMTEDGWFRSGDIGHLDGEGFLFITGRKKELIVTAAGKNVAPAALEDPLRAHPLISQAMIVGDGRPFIAALITLDADALPSWTSANGRTGATVAELADDPALVAEIQAAVDAANRRVSRAESVRAFRILASDFTIGEELSQKQSLKRHVILERYADVIDALYSSGKT
jgi:long-chain acyl-CoA synthetase